MLNFKEIENIQELNGFNIKSDNCLGIPLFHGTRRYALQITDEKRLHFLKACNQVISFARKLLDSGRINWNELSRYNRDKNKKFLSTVVQQYNTPQYQYGDLYLTTSFSTAVDFSHYPCGELGSYAYAQIVGFEDFGIELDEETATAAGTVIEEYEKYAKSEKNVLVFYGVDLKHLQNARGYPVLSNASTDEYIKNKKRYQKSIDTDSTKANHVFRLIASDLYTAYVLNEKDFRQAFSVLTNIKDVDKCIKNHNYNPEYVWEF